MGGLSFLNGMFLAAAAVAAVPIIIHLVQRRRIQQVVFGSVRFLRKMSHRVVRRRRLTELLLILLRTAALAALAAAFARPFFFRPAQRLGGETLAGDQAALVLIDNSYSMSADGRLEKAKKQARQVLDELGPAAKVGVGVFSSQFQLLCPIGSSLDEARSAVEKITQSYNGTDLGRALKAADDLLSGRQPAEQNRRLIVISDFARSAWQGRGDWKMTPGIPLIVRDVGEGDLANVYVERLAVPRIVVAGGFAEVISAVIANKSDKPLQNAEVVVKVGEQPAEKMSVNVRPRSSTPVRFRRTFKDPGDTVGSITVASADKLPADNTAYFCVHVTPQVKVLVVNGDPANQLVKNDAFFLMTALSPQVADQASPFALTEVEPSGLRPDQIKGTDAVILANVEDVPDAALAALKDFLQRGGGVGFVCGGKIRPDQFNARLGELAPCKLWKPALEGKGEPVVISHVDLKHEIFHPFDGPHMGDLASAAYVQFFAVKDSQAANVLARFSNGQPALLEKAVGNGRSLLFTSAMDLEWNNFCLKSIFVPFVHQMVRRLCGSQSGDIRDLEVGSQIASTLPPEVTKAELTTPSGKKQSLEPSPAGNDPAASRTVSFVADAPGLYELSRGTESAKYAANLDSREPDLTHLDTHLLVSAVQPKPISDVEKTAGAPSVVAKSTARERIEAEQKLWMYLFGLVLVALGAEMILAAREAMA